MLFMVFQLQSGREKNELKVMPLVKSITETFKVINVSNNKKKTLKIYSILSKCRRKEEERT